MYLKPVKQSVLIIWVVFITGLIAASCAPPARLVEPERPAPGLFPFHSLEDILYFMGNATRLPQSYESRASMRMQSPGQSGNFSAVLQQRDADSLFASISPGLGIEVARMLVTQDSFYVHDRLRNRLYFGSADRISTTFPFPVSIEEIAANLVGAIRPGENEAWLLSADEQSYLIASPDGRHVYTVDPATWRVVRYRETAGDGTLLEERLFSEFEIIDGFFIPRRVIMRRPLDNLAVNLYHRDIVLNPDGMDLRFRVDPTVPRVPF